MSYLNADGKWTGPPLLILQLRLTVEPKILDGNKRLKEYKARGLTYSIPTQRITSHVEAIRYLIINGHSDRAAMHAIKYYPQLVQYSSNSLSAILDLHRNKIQPYIKALKDPSQRHKQPKRAMWVVKKILRLRKGAQEGKPITLADLDEALGEFLQQ